MKQVSIEEAQAMLSELMDAACSGDDVVITKDGQHVVRLVPISNSKAVRNLAARND